MRRSDRQQDRAFALALMDRCTHGVMAIHTGEDMPYCLPLTFVRVGDDLYFHCAREGHKLDAIRREARASFCVVDRDDVKPAEYTSYFRSVIIFGRVRVLEDEAQKRAAIELLARRYFPEDSAENRRRAIEREWAGLCMLEMDIEHMSGKEAKELAREGGSKQ